MTNGLVMTTLILLAGGVGKRANLGVPKQYFRILDRMVIDYTLLNVSNVDEIDKTIIVSHREYRERTKELREKYEKIVKVVDGGRTRNESIYNGFKAIDWDEDKVLVHDAVRPFTPEWVFSEVIKQLDSHDVVTTVNRITGNLIEIHDGKVKAIYDRDKFVIGEAPTGYRYSCLEKALNDAVENGYLNKFPHDIQLAMKSGFDVYVLKCDCFNHKLTFKDDVKLFSAMILFAFSSEKNEH